MRQFLVALLCGFFLTGCVVLSSTSVDNVVAKSGPKAIADTSAIGILSLTLPDVNALEVAALGKIQGQGAVKNVTTRLEMRNWFGVVQVYKVTITGEKIAVAKTKGEAKPEVKGEAKPPVAE